MINMDRRGAPYGAPPCSSFGGKIGRLALQVGQGAEHVAVEWIAHAFYGGATTAAAAIPTVTRMAGFANALLRELEAVADDIRLIGLADRIGVINPGQYNRAVTAGPDVAVHCEVQAFVVEWAGAEEVGHQDMLGGI